MTNIEVLSGDIAQVETDALITAINSAGEWSGGIDAVIQRNAGSVFHQQAQDAMPLQHGQTVVAHGSGQQTAFKNVVFVIDDLAGRLSDIVYNGLQAASEAGFTSVTLPTIRMGVMLGQVEKSVDEALAEMADGLRRFKVDNPDSVLQDIKFVIYGDEDVENRLRGMLVVY